MHRSPIAPLIGVLRALWLHRRLITGLARRDFRIRSARAIWGHAWLVIHPAVQIALYVFVFANVLGARLPGSVDPLGYGLFLCAGLIHWNLFQELVVGSQSMFLEHADLVKTLRVPRSVLPAAITLSALVRHAIVVGVFLVVLAVTDHWPGWALVWGLPLIAVQTFLGTGLGVLSGTINVFFRDVPQATTTLLQLWFWLTPIVYPIAIVPDAFRELLRLNPMTPLVLAYQSIVLESSPPDPRSLLYAGAASLVVALISWGAFRALGADLVDEL